MKRFRIKDSVPDIYLKESRDFQLLCDLYDLVNSGVKFDIDTITHLSDTSLCRSSMLQFLQEKLGLSLREDVTDETLRTILKCFPFAVRFKGTKRGVAEMVCLFLNILYSDGSYIVEIENINDNTSLITSGLGNYVIAIATTVNDNRLKDLDILEDLLRYVIPAGYKIDYSMNIESKVFDTTSLSSDTVYITAFDERKWNEVRENSETSTLRYNLNSVGAVVVRATGIDEKDPSSLGENGYIKGSIPKEG